MNKEDLIPEYKFMDNFLALYDSANDQKIKELLVDMRDTILYQMNEIRKLRSEVIYVKHKYAWQRYDKSIDDYDSTTRRYKDNDHHRN